MNILSLSLEVQNNISSLRLFDQLKRDNAEYAKESGEEIVDYLLRDYDAKPEGWDVCFEFAYDEISSKAKEARRNIIERMLKAL